ncbi:MAG: recombinase family protein [Clostridia bacterium]|nr:recombinase family protein [Clostridia bacterium]
MEAVRALTPQVNVIPATKRAVESGGQFKKGGNLRVAAYCRVSTGDESQQTSYATQKKFYTDWIAHHAGWTFAGIYADEAISGTSRAHRTEFNKMIADAAAGKLDYIVTKSISRFARNTVDTLKCVRELRNLRQAVGIYFEKENIDTLDATGELILTILSALAQDESRSISDNIRWAIQKNFPRGKPMVNLKRTLGYEKGPNGEWVIVEEQAEIIRFIFRAFLQGTSAAQIARDLNGAGKKTVLGNIFRSDSVYLILRNEKYVGDVEMQKTVTKDFLTHRATRNTGEAPRYYIRDHHAAIVDRLTWNRAQALLSSRGASRAVWTEGEAAEAAGGGAQAVPARETAGRRERRGNPITGIVYQDEEGRLHPMYRTGYHAPARGYADGRSLAAQGLADDPHLREEYWFNNPLWKLREKGGKIRAVGRSYVDEVAIEQAFMEMLYAVKRDYEANGQGSGIVRQFDAFLAWTGERSGSLPSAQRFAVIDMQIREWEDALRAALSAQAEKSDEQRIADIRKELADKRAERAALERDQSREAGLRQNFELFLHCLAALPDQAAGDKIVVSGLDTSGAPWTKGGTAAPHLLTYERGLYASFIRGAKLKRRMIEVQKGAMAETDELIIEWDTSFGVKLTGRNVQRTLGSFLGYRRVKENGEVERIDHIWQAVQRTICYKRYEVKWKRTDQIKR